MKKTKFLILFIALYISGCTFKYMDEGLSALKGQDIEQAINYLGYPDNKQEIAGNKVYTWARAYTVSSVVPVQSYNSGNVSGYGGYANYNTTTTSYIPQTDHYSCNLKIITDKKDIIISAQYDGNMGGCSRYGTALKKASEELAHEELAPIE